MPHNEIILWYIKNKRNLPWRKTNNPYYIWLSEVILQQTRVSQGLPYYLKFIEHYPTIQHLADASEEEVLRLWQGLGYYSRGRNLHSTAKHIAFNLKGVFPNTYEDLKKLKGVGEYTAAAIASFSFGESVAAIDGNVTRVITRIYRIEEAIDLPKTKKMVASISQELISSAAPSLYNQAMMEFGAIICTPKKPKCMECPVRKKCLSFPDQAFKYIPIKSKKLNVLSRDIYYLALKHGNKYLLKKRTGTDIWQNLYDFPEISKEHLEHITLKNIQHHAPLIHVLTHRKLNIYFITAEVASNVNDFDGNWYSMKEIELLPKPKVIVDFFQRPDLFSI